MSNFEKYFIDNYENVNEENLWDELSYDPYFAHDYEYEK